MQDVQEALKRHASDFIDAYIFGSVLSGRADEYSDVDLLVVRKTESPFFDRIREIMSLRREFGNLDLLIYTPQELESMLSETGRKFVKDIVKTGYRMKEPKTDAERWFSQAENDLEFAKVGLRENFFAQVCFQCQQVCEKAIKSMRYGSGERIVYGHALVDLTKEMDLTPKLKDELAVLDQYYIPTRYPNGLPGGVPHAVYTKNQAEKAVQVASEVVELARQNLA